MSAPKAPAYRYAAIIERVVDGDTIVISLDLGMRTWVLGMKVRLVGCNAAESSTAAGKAAAANLTAVLPVGTDVIIDTVSDYKYGGEWCGRIWLNDRDLVADLIAQQWLAPWNGNGPRPVPPWPRTVT